MSEAKINMSLDQIISKNKGPENRRGRGGLRGRGRGAIRGGLREGLRGGLRGASRGNNRGGRGMRKLSNQNIPRRMDNNRNNFSNVRGGKRLIARANRGGRFGSERKIINNNGPRNMNNNKVIYLFSILSKFLFVSIQRNLSLNLRNILDFFIIKNRPLFKEILETEINQEIIILD